MYYNARYYNPHTGVFLQVDPVDDGLNHYAYVGGNPIMNVDPDGKCGPFCIAIMEFLQDLIVQVRILFILVKTISINCKRF